MRRRQSDPLRAKHERGGAHLLPARAQLLVALLRAAEHEAIFEERLEGLLKALPSRHHRVLSPRGVSLVFAGQVRARHRERRRAILGTDDLLEAGQRARETLADT